MAEQQIDGRRRVVIEGVSPEIDCGRFAIKRVVGETVLVDEDVLADGHDQVAHQILYWQDVKELQKSPMKPQDVHVDLLIGADPAFHGVLTPAQHLDGKFRHANDHYRVLNEEAAGRARGDDGGLLRDWAGRLRDAKDRPESAHIVLEEEPLGVLQRYPERHLASRYAKELTITVDHEKARDRACRGDGPGAPENRTLLFSLLSALSLAGSYSPWPSQLGWARRNLSPNR